MEEVYASVIPSILDGFLQGLILLWNIMTAHPLLFAFFVFLILRKIKYTFF